MKSTFADLFQIFKKAIRPKVVFWGLMAFLSLQETKAQTQSASETAKLNAGFYSELVNTVSAREKNKQSVLSYAEKCICCQEMALRKSDSGKSKALSRLLGKALVSLILSYYFAKILYKPNELFSFANTEKPKKYAFLTGSLLASFFLVLTVWSYFLQLDIAEAEYIMDLTKCLCD